MTASVHALRVLVSTHEEFLRLLAHPASLAGEYDPAAGHGEVAFPTFEAACAARRELDA